METIKQRENYRILASISGIIFFLVSSVTLLIASSILANPVWINWRSLPVKNVLPFLLAVLKAVFHTEHMGLCHFRKESQVTEITRLMQGDDNRDAGIVKTRPARFLFDRNLAILPRKMKPDRRFPIKVTLSKPLFLN